MFQVFLVPNLSLMVQNWVIIDSTLAKPVQYYCIAFSLRRESLHVSKIKP
jgi:hypothetical protein